ncbi:MAG: hypothetical protein JWO08_4222, partial [Verrucomicrobiaceae bacterium]|nr:hypothetical protein [Verrucomicrobiaceae bacterium]
MKTPLRSVLVLWGLLALAACGDPSPEMRSKVMALAPGHAKVFRVDLDLDRGW